MAEGLFGWIAEEYFLEFELRASVSMSPVDGVDFIELFFCLLGENKEVFQVYQRGPPPGTRQNDFECIWQGDGPVI